MGNKTFNRKCEKYIVAIKTSKKFQSTIHYFEG